MGLAYRNADDSKSAGCIIKKLTPAWAASLEFPKGQSMGFPVAVAAYTALGCGLVKNLYFTPWLPWASWRGCLGWKESTPHRTQGPE